MYQMHILHVIYMYALKQLTVSQDIECYRWVFHRAPFMKDSASIKVSKQVQISSTFKLQDSNSFHVCTSNLNCIYLSQKKKKKILYIYYSNPLNLVITTQKLVILLHNGISSSKMLWKLKHDHSRQQKHEKRYSVLLQFHI